MTSRAAEARHRVAALRGLVLLGRRRRLLDRLVLGEVQRHAGRGDDVAVGAQAVDARLDERRPLAGAGALDRRAAPSRRRHRIAAVDGHAGHAVGLRLDGERLAGRARSRPPARCACGRCSRCSPSRTRPAASTATRCSASRGTRPAWRRRRRRSRARPGPCRGSARPRRRRRRAGCPAATIPEVPRKPRVDVDRGASSRRSPCRARRCGRRSRPSSPSVSVPSAIG